MFSYDDYREIIRAIKDSKKGMKYPDAYGKDEFAIMRHDVEYSIERAYELSLVETEMDFSSTWFFQFTNNTYNPFSRTTMECIHKMRDNGHTIGLHYALDGETDMEVVRGRIPKQLEIMSYMLGFEINQFSIHRPPSEALAANFKYTGIFNAYQDDFFTYAEGVTDSTPLNVKYMSDANHIWRYGYPTRENIMNNKKVQILTHPFAWCEHGYDNHDNYVTLVKEKYAETIHSINDECKDFKEYLDEFLDARIDLNISG
ncbi:MAG: hypothetical protein K6G12_08505 [Lachnospiraceae bacterium]|nr:hypothetical protein [Lachnospiraceae bacterium]